MEMALNNGRHPLMEWDLGPRTGDVEDFTTFEDFFEAFGTQLRFLIEQAVSLNDLYAEAHARLRPTPFISSTIEGCIESARDITRGGARYNTTGTASIGLADVTDSLMTVKKLVFDERAVSFRELKEAVDADFRNNPALRAWQRTRCRFSSGSLEALHMCQRHCHPHSQHLCLAPESQGWQIHPRVRSMSSIRHMGNLPAQCPRKAEGKPFTPGLTLSRTRAETIWISFRTWRGCGRKTWTTTWRSMSAFTLRSRQPREDDRQYVRLC
jgi:formate C-acetyltransferase